MTVSGFAWLLVPLLLLGAKRAYDLGYRAVGQDASWPSRLAFVLFCAYGVFVAWTGHEQLYRQCYAGLPDVKRFTLAYGLPGLAFALAVFPREGQSVLGLETLGNLKAAHFLALASWLVLLGLLVLLLMNGCLVPS